MEVQVTFKFKCCKKFGIVLILPQTISTHSGRIHRRRCYSHARATVKLFQILRELMESQMKCATPRNRSRSKGIDERYSVTGAPFRCIVTLEGTKGRGRETVSRLPRGGRKHSYTSSDQIRNDTEVEEVETEMAPTWFRTRSNVGRRLQVWAIFRAVVIYLRAAASDCGDRLPLLGQPFALGARKLI